MLTLMICLIFGQFGMSCKMYWLLQKAKNLSWLVTVLKASGCKQQLTESLWQSGHQCPSGGCARSARPQLEMGKKAGLWIWRQYPVTIPLRLKIVQSLHNHCNSIFLSTAQKFCHNVLLPLISNYCILLYHCQVDRKTRYCQIPLRHLHLSDCQVNSISDCQVISKEMNSRLWDLGT